MQIYFLPYAYIGICGSLQLPPKDPADLTPSTVSTLFVKSYPSRDQYLPIRYARRKRIPVASNPHLLGQKLSHPIVPVLNARLEI